MTDEIKINPEETAKVANLIYVNDHDLCYKRRRHGKGFIYLDGEKEKVKDKELISYFKNLVIPPAWENVLICGKRNGHIQAVGYDAKGRKQYIYHPKWEEVSNETKFNRMKNFAEALPEIRERINIDLRKHGFTKEKVLAIIVRLLEETLIRIGNREYAKSNSSYGLTTLREKHIDVNGSTLLFQFKGKSGKEAKVKVNDRRLVRLIKQIQDLPGQHLFKYIVDKGEFHPVESTEVNEYLKEISGSNFTAKDFRTWGGSILAVEEFNQAGEFETKKAGEKNVVQVIKKVAKGLNNTPAVCKKYYIHPKVIDAYLDKSLFDALKKAARRNGKANRLLDLEEKAFKVMLESEN